MKRSIAVVLAALLLAACSKSGGDTSSAGTGAAAPAGGAGAGEKNRTTIPHTLRIGDTLDFDNLNPHLATAITLGNLNQLTEAYLVRYDAHNMPAPELATEVPTQKNGGVSKDGLTITWHLRRGVRWSDGAPFDGDDVVWSTNAVNNPANNEVGRDGWNLIKKIDEPDKFTVVFHLSKPYSGYLPTFFGSAGANPCVLPKHLLAGLPNINNAPYNSKPVGIGPFRYTEWVRGDHVTMERNPYYWRGTPKLDKIIFKIIPDRNTLLTQLQTGEVDMWTYVPAAYVDRVKALPNLQTFRGPSYLYAHIDFNTTHPGLREKVVREALRLATDRKLLRDKINHGIGILQESQVTPTSPFYEPLPSVPYDPTKANELLDQAGWKRGADGIRAKNGVKLNLVFASYTGSPDQDARIEQLRTMWQQIGVALDVKRYASALFFQLTGGIVYAGKFDVTGFAWQMTPDGDLNNINSCTEIPPNGQNVTRLCDSRVQQQLDAEKAAYDVDVRKDVITKAVRIISEEVPYEVLWIYEDVHAYNSDLKNFHPNNTTPFDDFLNVDI